MDGNDTSIQGHSDSLYSTEISIALILLLTLFDIVSISANGLVLMTVYWNPRLRSNTNVFITNLCLVDLIAGLLLMPLVIDSIGRDEARFDVLCELVGFIDATYSCASSLTIAVIALDRYHSIVNCLYYENIVTRRRTIIAILWIWVQTLAIALCPIVGWGQYAFDFAQFKCSLDLPDRHGFLWFMFCTSVVFPFAVIVFCYTQIHLVARRHAKNMVAIHIHDTGKRIKAVSTRKTKLVYLVVGIYAICWLPIYIVKLLQSIVPGIAIPYRVITLATFLSLLNGSCNPFLYALITSQYRTGMNRMNKRLRRKFGRPVATPSGDQSKSSWSVSRPISNLYRYFQENDTGNNMLACIGRTYNDDSGLDMQRADSNQKYLNTSKNVIHSPSDQRKINPQTLQIPNKSKNHKRTVNGWVGENEKSLSIPLNPIITQDHDADSDSDPEVSESKSLTRTNSLEKKNMRVKSRDSDDSFRKSVSFQSENHLQVIAESLDKELIVRPNSVLSTIEEVDNVHSEGQNDDADHSCVDGSMWENEELNKELGTKKNETRKSPSSSPDAKLQKNANSENRTAHINVKSATETLSVMDTVEQMSRNTPMLDKREVKQQEHEKSIQTDGNSDKEGINPHPKP